VRRGFTQIILIGAVAAIIALIIVGFFLYQRGLFNSFIPGAEIFPTPAPTEPAGCQKDSNCILAYTGENPCGLCDFSDPSYQCVSPQKAKELEEQRIKKHGQIACAPCELPQLLFNCACKDNICLKTAECKKNEDCIQDSYKCIEGKCTFSSADKTADWRTYTDTKFGIEFKHPNNWKVEEDYDHLLLFLYPTPRVGYETNADTIYIFRVGNPKHLTIEQAVGLDPNGQEVCCINQPSWLKVNYKKEDVIIGGIIGKKFIEYSGEESQTIILKDDLAYIFINNGEKPFNAIYNKILSTVRFLE